MLIHNCIKLLHRSTAVCVGPPANGLFNKCVLPPFIKLPLFSLHTTSTLPLSQVRSYLTRPSRFNRPTFLLRKGGSKRSSDEPVDPTLIDLSGIVHKMDATLRAMQDDYATLRTGRASPDMLQKVMVDVGGKTTPLHKLGSVSLKDPQTLKVTCFDDGVAKNVYSALTKASEDYGVSNSGSGVVLVSLPKTTNEYRQSLTKNADKMAEEAKIVIRKHRRDAVDIGKAKKLLKDDERVFENRVQTLTDQYIKKIEKLYEQKSKEIAKL